MARRLILDTCVLIASERGKAARTDVIAEDDNFAVAAITIAELRTGVELATERHRAARSEFLIKILETLPVEPYDVETTEAHELLLAHVHRSGTKRGAHDLVIAATAVATKRTILTTDPTRASGTCPR